MNVFDEEMGPLLSQEEAERLLFLIAADVVLDEYAAYMGWLDKEKVN